MASSKHLLKTPWRDHSKTPKEIDKLISLTASSSLATRRTIHFIEASRVDEKMSSLRLKYPAINIKKPDHSIPTTSKRTTDTEEPLQVSAIDKNIKKPEPKPLQVSTIDKKIKKPEPTDAKSKRKVDLEQRQALKNDISTIEPEKGVQPKITVKSDAKVQTVVQGPGDPQKVLFSPELLSPDWVGNPRIGTGFGNVGNTCFLNASLQCLGHIPAFVQYVKNGSHAKQCNLSRRKKFCALCALNQVYTKSANAKVYRPTPITANLQKIGGTMRTGDQEDAHEFVHSLFDSIQKSCLHGTDKKMDARSQETTFLHQVFGGYIENQIKCRSCGNESNRYEATLDLSLQVSDPGIQSVSQALANFTSPEILKGENKYECGKCNQKVVASRRSTVYKSPMALQIQLKRFAFCGRRGGKFSKVAKHIDYPDVLDMTPFLSKGMKVRSLYSLTGVLVHSGSSPTYGHYYAYCKNANGKWYLMNDDKVTPVEPHVALKQQAYMLYYTRIGSPDSTPKVQRRNSLTAMVTKMKAALSPNLSAEEPRNVKRDSDGDIEMNKIPIDDEEKPKRRLSFCERVINVVKGAVRPASIDFKLNAPEVFTWNGDKSSMQQGGKRQRPNLCDLEMDRGKSKKIRLRKKLATNHNPFQFHK